LIPKKTHFLQGAGAWLALVTAAAILTNCMNLKHEASALSSRANKSLQNSTTFRLKFHTISLNHMQNSNPSKQCWITGEYVSSSYESVMKESMLTQA
jgi:hypothetical protein